MKQGAVFVGLAALVVTVGPVAGDGGRPSGYQRTSVTGRAVMAGELSSWSNTAPSASAVTPSPAQREDPVLAAPSVAVHRASGTPQPAVQPTWHARSLTTTRLQRGWSERRVWEALGAPEYVRGRKDGIMFWHYGPGWIRFRAARVIDWSAGSHDRLSQRATP